MACLSELFFTTVDTDWSYDGQEGSPPQFRLRLMHSDFTRNEQIRPTRKRRPILMLDAFSANLARDGGEASTSRISSCKL